MPADWHERARILADRAAVEGLAAEDQRWLDGHLTQCEACSEYAALSARAIRALDGFAFELDPAAALRAEQAARIHAERLALAESARRQLAWGIVLAILLTAAGSAAMWLPAAWLAARWNLPAAAWHAAFVALWLVPSVMAIVPLLFHRAHGGGETV